MATQFLWSDAWVLLAVVAGETNECGCSAAIQDAIEDAHFVQRGIGTFAELEGAPARLTAAGYVVEDEDGTFWGSREAHAPYYPVHH